MKTLAYTLFARQWKNITGREAERGALRSRFGRVRVRAAHHNEVRPEEWLVIEWPLAETEPIKYWLSNLPETTPFKQKIRLIKLRWRIERDYQELQAGDGSGPLRRTQLARLPPSRQSVHRLVRFPDALSALRKKAQ